MKKKKQNWLTKEATLKEKKRNGIILIFVFILSIGIIIYLNVNKKPEFIIYKNECVNKTIQNGMRDFNFIASSSETPEMLRYNPYGCWMIYVRFMDSKGSMQGILDYPCEYYLINMSTKQVKSIENVTLYTGKIIEITYINDYTTYTYLVKAQFPNYSTEQKCSKVEVEKIETKESIEFVKNYFDYCAEGRKAVGEEFYDICMKNYNELKNSRDSRDYIPKKDLTKEWLETNCECIEGEYECKSGKLTNDCFNSAVSCCYILLRTDRPEPDYKCSKYKCFSDYKIKVD